MSAFWLAFDTALIAASSLGAHVAWRREQLRTATAARLTAATAEHLRLAGGEHQCCRLVDGEQCGLWCCHGGVCTAYLPGSYLSVARLVHPLALARLTGPLGRCCCPLCQRPVNGWERGAAGLYLTFIDGVEHRSVEEPWQFTPCGCTGRVIV